MAGFYSAGGVRPDGFTFFANDRARGCKRPTSCDGEQIAVGQCRASTAKEGNPCRFAFDYITDTLWQSVGESAAAWIEAEFKGSHKVQRVELLQQWDYNEMVRDYVLLTWS